jgi:tetratricopeptide (TPR) repeat protein
LSAAALFSSNASDLHNRSLEAYDKALELDQEHFSGLEQKGDALMDLGRYEEALAAYEKATVVDPAFPRPRETILSEKSSGTW